MGAGGLPPAHVPPLCGRSPPGQAQWLRRYGTPWYAHMGLGRLGGWDASLACRLTCVQFRLCAVSVGFFGDIHIPEHLLQAPSEL